MKILLPLNLLYMVVGQQKGASTGISAAKGRLGDM